MASSFYTLPLAIPCRRSRTMQAKASAIFSVLPTTMPSCPQTRLPSTLGRQSLSVRLNLSSQKQSGGDFERLFSNLNEVTLKREPGSLSSAVFLVAGTTVGAGILAITAVTQEAKVWHPQLRAFCAGSIWFFCRFHVLEIVSVADFIFFVDSTNCMEYAMNCLSLWMIVNYKRGTKLWEH